jgi:hypothetical protein
MEEQMSKGIFGSSKKDKNEKSKGRCYDEIKREVK